MAKKKSIPVPKHSNKNLKIVFMVSVALVALAILVGLYFSSSVLVGQADAPPVVGIVNLQQQDTYVSSVLTLTPLRFTLELPVSSAPAGAVKRYFLSLAPNDLGGFSYLIETEDGVILQDVLSAVSGGDVSILYVDDDDVPDLRVLFQSGRLTLQSAGAFLPSASQVSLIGRGARNENQDLTSLIRLREGEELKAQVVGMSVIVPMVNVTINGQPVVLTDMHSVEATHRFEGLLSWIPPAGSGAYVIDVASTVRGRTTHFYYTIAVGSVVYALQEPQFPLVLVKTDDQGKEQLNVTLKSTLDLQPFALPCELENPAVERFFSDPAVYRVYTWNGERQEAMVWTRSAPSDFVNLLPGVGYFVELSEAKEVNIQSTCSRSVFEPALAPAIADQKTLTFSQGWNLISLPGVVPQPMAGLNNNFLIVARVVQCTQSYSCIELPVSPLLIPGKPYWVYLSQPTKVDYTLRELQ